MTRSRLLPIALAASALLLPALPASATEASGAEPRQKVEAWAVPGSSAITITGHGFGHGNGMSQYGALGAAQQGLTWQQINEFYYPGTTWERSAASSACSSPPTPGATCQPGRHGGLPPRRGAAGGPRAGREARRRQRPVRRGAHLRGVRALTPRGSPLRPL